MTLRPAILREAAAVAAYTMICYVVMISGAYAADIALQTDYLSQLDPMVVGALSGFAGGTIRAVRSDVPTLKAMKIDALPGAFAGGFAWPMTLTIFGPVLSTLQSTADVVLTIGAKVGVAGLLTGACLSFLIGAAESVFRVFTERGGAA